MKDTDGICFLIRKYKLVMQVLENCFPAHV
jgi:hypothetical protein